MLKLTKVLNSLIPNPAAASTVTSDSADVIANLQRLRRSHSLIYVTRAGTAVGGRQQRAYQSIILDVNPTSGTLDIDELFPKGLVLRADDHISITIRESKHRSLTFHTRVTEQISDTANPGYRLQLPAHLDGHQRRAAFRLATNGSARWQLGDSAVDDARVSDISISGLQLALPATAVGSAPIVVGEAIENCTVQLPSLGFTCDLRVTRVADSEDAPGITTIGAQMVTLDSAERRKLEQFIMREQRLRRLRSAV